MQFYYSDTFAYTFFLNDVFLTKSLIYLYVMSTCTFVEHLIESLTFHCDKTTVMYSVEVEHAVQSTVKFY